MWDLPGPGLEPVSPALAGGFLTTAPPGKVPHIPNFNSTLLLWPLQMLLPLCVQTSGSFQGQPKGMAWPIIPALPELSHL